MKKLFFPLILGLLLPSALCRADIIEGIWNKYTPQIPAIDRGQEDAQKPRTLPPGRLMGKPSPEREADFRSMWKYRMSTYELHFDNPGELARTAYGLALHSGDIDPSLKPETFVAGVLGFHYSIGQICSFANDLFSFKTGFVLDDGVLLGYLLADGIITVKNGSFIPTGKAGHVLAAAPGKRRDFARNLRHERLHVFWDEDTDFQDKSINSWKQMPSGDKARVREEFYRYAQKNETQIAEEWAIKNAEASDMKID